MKHVAKNLLPKCVEYSECHQLPLEIYEELESRESIVEASELTVYPNPTKDYLYINYPMDKVLSYDLISTDGIVVYSKENPIDQELKLDMRAGVYHLVLNLQDGTKESTRFVVIN